MATSTRVKYPGPVAVLRFDSNYESHYTVAYKYAKERNIPMLIALSVNDSTGSPRFLTDAMIREMASDPLVTFCSHGKNHKGLSAMHEGESLPFSYNENITPCADAATLTTELSDSKTYVESVTGKTCDGIVYPVHAIKWDGVDEAIKLGYKWGGTPEVSAPDNSNAPVQSFTQGATARPLWREPILDSRYSRFCISRHGMDRADLVGQGGDTDPLVKLASCAADSIWGMLFFHSTDGTMPAELAASNCDEAQFRQIMDYAIDVLGYQFVSIDEYLSMAYGYDHPYYQGVSDYNYCIQGHMRFEEANHTYPKYAAYGTTIKDGWNFNSFVNETDYDYYSIADEPITDIPYPSSRIDGVPCGYLRVKNTTGGFTNYCNHVHVSEYGADRLTSKHKIRVSCQVYGLAEATDAKLVIRKTCPTVTGQTFWGNPGNTALAVLDKTAIDVPEGVWTTLSYDVDVEAGAWLAIALFASTAGKDVLWTDLSVQKVIA